MSKVRSPLLYATLAMVLALVGSGQLAAAPLGVPISNELNAEVEVRPAPPPPPPPPRPRPSPAPEPTVALAYIAVEVGTEGGSVSTDDGRLVITVPTGALAQSAVVSIEAITEDVPVPEGLSQLSAQHIVRAVTAEGDTIRTFDAPIAIGFRLADLGDVAPHELHVYYWDDGLGCWLPVPTIVDPEEGIVEGYTDHLTTFCVLRDPGFPRLDDVRGHWAEADVLRLAALRVVSGYEDGRFRPNRSVSRAEFVKLVALAAGIEPDPAAAQPFADVVPAWAAGYVAAAAREGLVAGYEDGTFRPHKAVTRLEACAFLAGLLEAVGYGPVAFADADRIPEWGRGAARMAVQEGIVLGIEEADGLYFRADQVTTRAQAATMIWRYVQTD